MQYVKDILHKKGSHIESVAPDSTVINALQVMAAKNIGSVVVMQGDQILGVMTERDYCRKVILRGKNSSDTLVSEIMTTDLPSVKPTDSIDHCMALMNDRRVRYLPVYDGGKLSGIISMTDVVSATIVRQQQTIHQLESYITGS